MGFLIIETIHHIFKTLLLTISYIYKLVYCLAIIGMIFAGFGMYFFGGKIRLTDI